MKVALLQISDVYYEKDSIYRNIESFYKHKHKDGYYKHEDFLEYPTWMLLAAYNLRCDKEVIIVRSSKDLILYTDANYVMCSVMNNNFKVIQQIIELNPNINFIVGGYIPINKYPNVLFVDSIDKLNKVNNIESLDEFYLGYDYSIFPKEPTIPRLQLSTGCTANCKFCTVTKTLKEIPTEYIHSQLKSFRELEFKLIYIDDKSFGQAKNYKDIKLLYEYITIFNPIFKGFIVQTTFRDYILKLHNTPILDCIEVIEFGLETYNEDISILYNKNKFADYLGTINKVLNSCYLNNIKVIFNIIVGFPEENIKTYANTLLFLEQNKEKIYNINIYPYADYNALESESSVRLKGVHKKALSLFINIQKEIIKQKNK